MAWHDYFQTTKSQIWDAEDKIKWPGRGWLSGKSWGTLALGVLACLVVAAIVGLVVAFPPAGGVGAGIILASLAATGGFAGAAFVPLVVKTTLSALLDVVKSPYTFYQRRQAAKMKAELKVANRVESDVKINDVPDVTFSVSKDKNGKLTYKINNSDKLDTSDMPDVAKAIAAHYHAYYKKNGGEKVLPGVKLKSLEEGLKSKELFNALNNSLKRIKLEAQKTGLTKEKTVLETDLVTQRTENAGLLTKHDQANQRNGVPLTAKNMTQAEIRTEETAHQAVIESQKKLDGLEANIKAKDVEIKALDVTLSNIPEPIPPPPNTPPPIAAETAMLKAATSTSPSNLAPVAALLAKPPPPPSSSSSISPSSSFISPAHLETKSIEALGGMGAAIRGAFTRKPKEESSELDNFEMEIDPSVVEDMLRNNSLAGKPPENAKDEASFIPPPEEHVASLLKRNAAADAKLVAAAAAENATPNHSFFSRKPK